MLAYLKGRVLGVGPNYAIIENGGLGYRVVLAQTHLFSLKTNDEVECYLHEHQREDGRELYGFQTIEELQLADKLLTVSGVGPKIAQVLVGLGVAKVRQAILLGDVNVFLSVSGIGKKRAQQIVLELKGTIDLDQIEGGAKDDVVLGLEHLGYGAKEIAEVMRKIDRSGSSEDRLRAALSCLAGA